MYGDFFPNTQNVQSFKAGEYPEEAGEASGEAFDPE